MTVEEAVRELNVIKYCEVDGRKQIEAIDIAVAALQEEKIGGPLTLEQLRGMGGKPYWHVGLQDDSPEPHWKILDPFVARCPEDYGYGKRWIAYAYPPAHIDREAWTAEWLYDTEKDIYICANCHHAVCASNYLNSKLPPYCEMCGRAMTPEAWDELEKRLRGEQE